MSTAPTATAETRVLWEIGDDLAALEALLLASGGEITEAEAEAEVDRWLSAQAETKAERDAKLDGYCSLLRELETRAALRDDESARISGHAIELLEGARQELGINQIEDEALRVERLAERDRQAAESLESRLLAFFQLHGHRTLETLRFRITAAKNGGLRKLVLDEQAVPDEYRKTVMVPDKDAIRAHLEAGGSLGFARLEERGARLVIK